MSRRLAVRITAAYLVVLLLLAATGVSGCRMRAGSLLQANTTVQLVAESAQRQSEAVKRPLAPPELEGVTPPLPAAPPTFPLQLELIPPEPPQGEVFVVAVHPGSEGPVTTISGMFGPSNRRRPVRFAPAGRRWVGLGPTSYYLRPGRYPLDLKVVSGEREESYRLQVEVVSRDFPTQHLQVSASTASKKTREKAAEDWRKICAAKANSHNEALWYRPFTAPLEGRLSSEFGLVRYVNGRLSGRHSGIDVAVPEGTPVHAANAGYVVLSECLHIGGCTIILDHGVNVFSSYSHLSKRLVEVGDYVEHGEKIGEVGSTGFSTGPHLHWSMTIGITPTDPRKFLSRDSDIAPFVGSLQQELEGFGAGN